MRKGDNDLLRREDGNEHSHRLRRTMIETKRSTFDATNGETTPSGKVLPMRKEGVQQRGLDIYNSIIGRLLVLTFCVQGAYLLFFGGSGLLDNEHWLAETESSLKAIIKMTQVDNKMLEDKGESLEKKLNKMEFLLTRLQVEAKAIKVQLESFREELVVSPSHIKKLVDEGESLEKKLKEVQLLSTRVQVQVEAIDQNIEGHLGSLKEDLVGKVELQSALSHRNVTKLEDKGVSLENQWKTCLSKEEFARFVNRKIADQEVNWNTILAVARDTMKEETDSCAAYGLKKVDYALGPLGGEVIRHSTSYLDGNLEKFLVFLQLMTTHPLARRMLQVQPNVEHPWCFKLGGTSGFIEIKLRTAIIPESVTLQHLAKSVDLDWFGAPKEFKVSGWMHGSKKAKIVTLGEFVFDLQSCSVKTFDLHPCTSASCMVNVIRLDIISNHGNQLYTCIYRVKVHGSEH